MTAYNFEALSGAIGEMLNEFGGLRTTRLVSAVTLVNGQPPPTQIVVEHSYDWPTSGMVAIDGITYHYTTNDVSTGTLGGIYVLIGGIATPGIQANHRQYAAVVDTSQTYSALDQLRESMLVDTAIGDDLSIVGRNLGIPRLPYVQSDDQYRAIVKAMAYNPRGTLYGLELALNALVGTGNYTITEDLVNNPCVITVSIPGSYFLNDFCQGKSFLSGPTAVVNSAPSNSFPPIVLAPGQTYALVSSIRLPNETFSVITDHLPNASEGWVYSGATSGGAYPDGTGALRFANGTGQPNGNYIYHASGITPADTYTRVCLRSYVNSAAINGYIPFLSINDGQRQYSLAYVATSGASPTIQLFDGDVLQGAHTLMGTSGLITAAFNELDFRVTPTNVQFYMNGVLQFTVVKSSFTNATSEAPGIYAGALYNPGSSAFANLLFYYIAVTVDQRRDYWAANGADASYAGSPNAQTITLASLTYQPSDAGKQLRLMHSHAVNGAGGNNNGTFFVQPDSAAHSWHLAGATFTNAQTDGVHTSRITIENVANCFTYPDDLGKSIVVRNSSASNNGTYTIVKLLDPNSATDLSTFKTKLKSFTNICEVAATFTPESGLTAQLMPNFITESALNWELSAAGSFSVAEDVLTVTPRQTLPVRGPYNIEINNVLSAHVMPQSDPLNYETSEGPPPTYSYWPFYVSDPYNVVEEYINLIVAAGIQVNFNFT